MRIPEARTWLVNLAGAEGDVFGVGATGGVLALYWRCTHLGCTVPWNPAFDGAAVNFPGVHGWFRCPCHGSTFSRAAVRVYGPAPRDLDTFALERNPDGSLTILTGSLTSGSAQPPNPRRAISYG